MAKQNPQALADDELDHFAKLDEFNQNNRLIQWLSDDAQRPQLLQLINKERQGQLELASRDNSPRDDPSLGPVSDRPAPGPAHKKMVLITDREQIKQVLGDKGEMYSNRAYAELGGGNFMLALDPNAGPTHALQVEAYKAAFPNSPDTIRDLAYRACREATVTSLRGTDFDLADFASQAAIRFCMKLMGYSLRDFLVVEKAAKTGYTSLVYQVLGRHFTTDPTAIPAAKQATAPLLARSAALIDAHARNDTDALKGTEDDNLPAGFKPVLYKLSQLPGNLNGEQRAVIAAGTVVGTVGNVQTAACVTVQALFKDLAEAGGDRSPWDQARALTRVTDKAVKDGRTNQYDAWKKLIGPLLAANPPIPFLPRVKLRAAAGGALLDPPQEVLLALGGGAGVQHVDNTGDDPLIWGLLGAGGRHGCLGKELAWPLIIEIVRHVMSLQGLAEKLDPETAEPFGLKRRWGFNCERYGLTHQRDRLVAQSTLNVAMRLKSPVRDSADQVRAFLRVGAPRIEEALRQARHVHFAWFELIESDSVLVLHTVYDGPFEAYIQHFAMKVADVFDALFQFIEDPPPLPVDKFPNDFIAHLKRYNRSPAMGYLFSAYPNSEVAQILRDEWARP